MDPTRLRALYGCDEAPPPTTRLRAGPLVLDFRAGQLRNLCVDGVEVWHGVAFVFRDPDWGTPAPEFGAVDIGARDDAFTVRCTGRYPGRLDFRLEIEGTAEGRIRFAAEATMVADVATNRTGICVMHPMAVGGRRVEVLHDDGRSSASTFPTLVPPWPPFTLIRALRHEYADRCWACCRFEGDVFELEDQRNNADASFKTYSRSNLMPRPYVPRAGEVLRQAVELIVEPRGRFVSRAVGVGAADPVQAPITLRIEGPARPLPSLGIEIGVADLADVDRSVHAAAALSPAFLHLALDPATPPVDARALRRLLDATGTRLRVDLVGDNLAATLSAIDTVGRALRDAGIVPDAVAAFPGDARAIDAARRAFPGVPIGSGTPHYMAQLNRLEGLGPVDFLTFTTASIVHGADDEDVMAGLACLPSLVETARARHGVQAVRLGPCGIGVRRSPLGAQPASDGTSRRALARRDPRVRGRFGAAWTLGYLAALASAGLDALTLFALSGEAGLIAEAALSCGAGASWEAGPPGNVGTRGNRGDGAVLPDDNTPSTPRPASALPTGVILAEFGSAHAPASVRVVRTSAPGRVAALVIDDEAGSTLHLANLVAEPQGVDLRDLGADCTAIGLDAYETATRELHAAGRHRQATGGG